ncbi:hypothetical protein BD410DRAFT_696524, partial [Rickenella mellea]
VSPLYLIAVFIALVLNVFGHVTRPWCNVVLRLLKKLLEYALPTGENDLPYRNAFLKAFPLDVRAVRKTFDLEAETTIYASCPKCCCTYKPTWDGKVFVYPP